MSKTVNRTQISVTLLLTLQLGMLLGVSPLAAYGREIQSAQSELFPTDHRKLAHAALLRKHIVRCASNPVCIRILAEYAAILSGNAQRVLLPIEIIFRNEKEVLQFQRRAGISSAVVDGIRVELQPDALKSYLAARKQANQRGLDITPRGVDSSRRSYEDTVVLWHGRVSAAVKYWVSRGRLTRRAAEKLRSLSTERQVSEVLALEEKQIYFGASFAKSILQSVAAPGASQHNAMLALDIKEHANIEIRKILAKHGWFQTVRNDAPHFTYLGVPESALSARGLTRANSNGRTVWVPSLRVPRIESANGRVENVPIDEAKESNSNRKDQPQDRTDRIAASALKKPIASVRIRSAGVVGPNVVIPKKTEFLLRKLTQLYFDSAGEPLHITSGYRSPERQASAMYQNLVNFGYSYVIGTYKRSRAANEILVAYRRNRRHGSRAIVAMTRVIQAQIRRRVYISDHLLGRAFDIRLSSARLNTLREVVQRMGGRVGVEADHYHVEF